VTVVRYRAKQEAQEKLERYDSGFYVEVEPVEDERG
jgi:hypothetical protein